jgi:hypothetical protein
MCFISKLTCKKNGVEWGRIPSYVGRFYVISDIYVLMYERINRNGNGS